MAIEDAGVVPDEFDKSRLAMIGGTTAASVDSIEKHLYTAIKDDPFNAPPYAFASITVHAAVGEAAQSMNLFDSSTTVSTHCTSGLNAIGLGLKEIREGRKDIVVAGATESTVSYYAFISYILAGLLVHDDGTPPEKIMCPFDKNRRGGVVAEGSAFVVLEELEHALARGAHIYGEVAGHGYKNRLTGPKSTKRTMVNAMNAALSDARIPPDEVEYILANGTSVVVQDMMETKAIKEVFGRQAYRMPISAIKSMIGIPNSAIGPMQLVSALLSFETDIIPPTINYETPDPECDLDYVPNTARLNRVNVTLINNLGMDGACAVLVAKRYCNGD
jgi:3-oxoacyl-[acyl-carrier-protein] synthase II